MSKQRRESTIKLRDRRSKEKQVNPVSEQPSILAFTVVSEEESKQLLHMMPNELESKFQEKFQLNSDTDLKDGAILDYYVGAVFWCQQQGYTSNQLSIFFTIVHRLLQKIVEDHVSLVSLITEFHHLLFESDKQYKPPSKSFFSDKQVKEIIDYVSSSLFNHYHLYRYVTSFPQKDEIITGEMSVEVPLDDPVPLDEGLPEEVLTSYFNEKTSSISAEPDGEELNPASETEIELPTNIEDIFGKLTLEDVQTIINEACTRVLNNLQADIEHKIQGQENFSLAKINKVYIVNS